MTGWAAEQDSQMPSGLDLVGILHWRAHHQAQRIAYRFLEDNALAVADCPGQVLTYGQLWRRVQDTADQLSAHPANRDADHQQARVVLSFNPGLDFVVGFLACLRAGAVAVPLPPPGRHRRMQRFLGVVRDALPDLVLTQDSLVSDVTGAMQQLDTGRAQIPVLSCEGGSGETTGSPSPGGSIAAAEGAALLQYTSGSTGAPKGVVVTHANLRDNLEQIRVRFGHDTDSRGVIWLPPYHDMGLIGGILQPLFVGFPVTLMAPASFLRRPLRWLQAIGHFAATTSGGPNFAFEHCLARITPEERAQLDLSTWRVAFTGAEVVHAATLREFADAFAVSGFSERAWLPCFGMAEATLMVTGNPVDQAPTVLTLDRDALAQSRVERTADDDSRVTVLTGNGRVMDNGQLLIVDPASRQTLADDQVGEIWLSGPSIASGYWARERETAEVFTAYTVDGRGPFLRTGDLGFLHAGELFVSGRLKDLIILRGRNLYPADIERRVEQSHAALAAGKTAAFTIDEGHGERLVIAHEPPRQFAVDQAAEVFAAVLAVLSAEFDASAHAILLLKPGQLPMTASGKVQRRACSQRYADGSFACHTQWQAARAQQPVAAANRVAHKTVRELTASDIESWIREWLARRLGLSPADIDVQRPLAEFGLDSLAAVELAGDLGQLTGREQPLSETTAWRYPTIAALAAHVSTGNDAGSSAVPPVQTTQQAALDDAVAMLEAELEQARRRSG